MAKREVAIPLEPCCAKAFLSGLVHSIGSIIVSEDGLGLEIASNNARLLRAGAKLFYEIFGIRAAIKDKVLTVSSERALPLLIELGILRSGDEVEIERELPSELIEKRCCKQNYCKGVFMGSGTVIAPSGGGYHLEFSLSDPEFASAFSKLLKSFGFPAKVRLKNGKPSVYVKSVDAVCDVLALVGASGAVLHLNNLAAERQMRQIANRNENCDLANIEKTVKAATSLTNKLSGITDKIKDKELKRTAELRLAHPEATYAELANLLGISKSGLAHRLRKLEEFAESFNGEI